MDIERTFEVCGCMESQKVLYTSSLLQGEVATWWNAKRQLLKNEIGIHGNDFVGKVE